MFTANLTLNTEAGCEALVGLSVVDLTLYTRMYTLIGSTALSVMYIVVANTHHSYTGIIGMLCWPVVVMAFPAETGNFESMCKVQKPSLDHGTRVRV